MTTDSTPLSVVVPTFNRSALLERCVRSVLGSVSAETEVVVSDDGSGDDTAAVVESLRASDARVRWVTGPNKGPAGARNRGWRASRGAIIAFIDDDCEADPGWGDAVTSALAREPSWAGVEGKTRPAGASSRFFTHTIESWPGAYLSCNLAFRRTALETVSGFDEAFPFAAGEDLDLAYRVVAGVGPIGWVPEARARHAVLPAGARYHLRRLRYDPSFYRLYALHPDRFRSAMRVVRLPVRPALEAGAAPMPAEVMAYLMVWRAANAWQCLRRGSGLPERMMGFATHALASALSLTRWPAGRRAHRDAMLRKGG